MKFSELPYTKKYFQGYVQVHEPASSLVYKKTTPNNRD